MADVCLKYSLLRFHSMFGLSRFFIYRVKFADSYEQDHAK